MRRSEVQAVARAEWVRSVDLLSGPTSPHSMTWREPAEIAAALSHVLGSDLTYTHLPTGGGLTFTAVQLSTEEGCLDFCVRERHIYRMKPTNLIFERIESNLAESFFLLELGRLDPAVVYPPEETEMRKRDFRREELVEINTGEFFPRWAWDEGETPDGEDLPNDAKLIVRMSMGKAIFLSKGSFWNDPSQPYDGQHSNMSAGAIRRLIERHIWN